MEREQIYKAYEGAKLYAIVHVDRDNNVVVTTMDGSPVKEIVRMLRHAADDLASGEAVKAPFGQTFPWSSRPSGK